MELLAGRRVSDVAVDAAGAAVDELADAGGLRLLQADARAPDVNVPVIALGDIELPEGGGQMKHDLRTRHASAHRGQVGNRTDDDLGPPGAQLRGLKPLLVVEGHHLVTVVE